MDGWMDGCGLGSTAAGADCVWRDSCKQARETPIAWAAAKQKPQQQQPPSEGGEEAAAVADRRAVEAGAPAAFMDFRCVQTSVPAYFFITANNSRPPTNQTQRL